MAYNVKKQHLKNWNLQNITEKVIFNGDQDSYISERSSTASSDGNTTAPPNPTNKRLPTPPVYAPPKKSHTLRYHYNELPENRIPLATQMKSERKEEKKRRKNLRKAPPGQGSLVPVPETKSFELDGNYYPYWHYYQAKNPDYTMRHRQAADGQLMSYDSVDPSQYVHEPGLTTTTTPIKARRHHRKSHRHPDAPIMPYNPNIQPYEHHRSPSKQYIPLRDIPQTEPNSRTKSRHHHKHKSETALNGYHVQSITSKSPQDSNNHSTHRSNKIDKSSPNENKRHHHHDDYIPSIEYVDSEFKVTDASFKKSERTPYFQQRQNSFHLPPPAIYNQTSYLPPIRHDFYYKPISPEYYNLLSQQTFDKNWKESIETPKIYKPDSQARFYDRYLNNVIDKRLTAL